EQVQLALERLLPELRDLEQRNIFSKEEISDIVAKRRSHELSLAKRDVRPADYLRYIEYESKLEKLRKIRANRMKPLHQLDSKGRPLKQKKKKSLSDHSIQAHITHLHQLSVRRFPHSQHLWDALLSHALSQSSPLLVSKTLSSAIALHPTISKYWVMASHWESEGDERGLGGGNPEAARRFCMRGLRFLKGGSEEMDVWKEWVRVEVSNAERVRKRWEVLGIGKDGEDFSKFGKKTVDKEDGMDVDEEEEDQEELADDRLEEPENELMDQTAKAVQQPQLSGPDAIKEGAVVRLVLDSCLSCSFPSLLPSSFEKPHSLAELSMKI
ncbi:hypothetical protein T439DRAFT_288471, partial [Meredithblackwellia eburnea MCA 4105]